MVPSNWSQLLSGVIGSHRVGGSCVDKAVGCRLAQCGPTVESQQQKGQAAPVGGWDGHVALCACQFPSLWKDSRHFLLHTET